MVHQTTSVSIVLLLLLLLLLLRLLIMLLPLQLSSSCFKDDEQILRLSEQNREGTHWESMVSALHLPGPPKGP